jgi:hypothetical protein
MCLNEQNGKGKIADCCLLILGKKDENGCCLAPDDRNK